MQTEYPELSRRYFAKHGIDADVQLSYGATEAKVPDMADAIVELTETGRALRAAGLKIIDTVLVSYTELIANPTSYQDPAKRKAMEQLQSLLSGALEARGRVLLKLNVDAANLDAVVALLPALKSPTVSKLSGEEGYAVETVVSKSEINTLDPRAQGRRRGRDHRARRSRRSSTERERRLRMVTGRVVEFDDHRGLGEVEADDGRRFPFHCTAIADGTAHDPGRHRRRVRGGRRTARQLRSRLGAAALTQRRHRRS